jgi:hypothetical protein
LPLIALGVDLQKRSLALWQFREDVIQSRYTDRLYANDCGSRIEGGGGRTLRENRAEYRALADIDFDDAFGLTDRHIQRFPAAVPTRAGRERFIGSRSGLEGYDPTGVPLLSQVL